MTLSTQFVREFLKKAARIKHNGVLPIRDNVRLIVQHGKATFFKSTGPEWCIYTIDGVLGEDDILFDERELAAFVNNINTPTFDYSLAITTPDPKLPPVYTVTLKAGRTKAPFRGADTKEYAMPPFFEDNPCTLSPELVTAIQEATNFINTNAEDLREYLKCVHVSNNEVWASDSFIAYRRKMQFAPTMIITEPALRVIATMQGEVEFNRADTFNFFTQGNVSYGFQDKEVKTPTYDFMFPSRPVEFTVSKAEIVSYCNLAKTKGVKFAAVNITGENGVLHLSTYDTDFERGADADIDAEFTGELPAMSFNAEQLLKVLNATQDEAVSIGRTRFTFHITTSDESLHRLIQGLMI